MAIGRALRVARMTARSFNRGKGKGSSTPPSTRSVTAALAAVVKSRRAATSLLSASVTATARFAQLNAYIQTSGFALPTVSDGVTWNRYALTLYPGSFVSTSFKHVRFARRTVDACWYCLGGDYSQGGDWPGQSQGSAINLLWKLTPGEPFGSWTRENQQVSSGNVEPNGAIGGKPYPSGAIFPSHCDEDPWMYDSKRDRFLFYPGGSKRWTTLEGGSLDYYTGRMMTYDPVSKTFTDRGIGPYNGTWNSSQVDPVSGLTYPGDGYNKWGFYDEATDRYYITWQEDGRVLVLNAADLSIVRIDNFYPTLIVAKWYTASLLFDRKRRRIAALTSRWLNDDPGTGKITTRITCYDIDTGVPYNLPQNNFPFEDIYPPEIDTEALTYDELNDLYVLYGGGLVLNGDSGATHIETNDMRVIPADGGTWKKLLPATATVPPRRFTQVIHFDPRVGKLFMMGGIAEPGSTAESEYPATPEIFYPVINTRALGMWPVWRQNLTANRWAQVGTNTLADHAVDPRWDATINPYGAGNTAPWDGYSGTSSKIVGDWCGAAWDEIHHELALNMAGGHTDYAGNESYKINLGVDAPAWVLYHKPSGAIGTGVDVANEKLTDGDGSGCYSDGRPRSVHTYNYALSVPNYGFVQARLCAYSDSGHDSLRAYKIDRVTGNTSLICNYSSQPNAGAGSSNGAACYDISRHCLWLMSSGGCQLQKINLKDGSIVACGSTGNHAGGNPQLIYVEEYNALVLLTKTGSSEHDIYGTCLITINLNDFSYHGMQVTGAYASGFGCYRSEGFTNPTQVPGLLCADYSVVGAQWDRRRKRLVLWGNDTNRAQLSALTPGANFFTDPWTASALAVDVGNSVIPSPQQVTGTYGRFQLSETLDCAILLNDHNGPVYVFAFS